MNRRGFIGSLGLGAAGLLATSDFDWERLLWKPKPIIAVPGLPNKGTFRVWMDDVPHVFRNVDLFSPQDLFIDGIEAKRVLGRIEVELDVPIRDSRDMRQPPKFLHELSCLHKGLILYPGNTLTVQLPKTVMYA